MKFVDKTTRELGFSFVPKDQKSVLFEACQQEDNIDCRCGCGKKADGFACKGKRLSLLVREDCFDSDRFHFFVRGLPGDELLSEQEKQSLAEAGMIATDPKTLSLYLGYFLYAGGIEEKKDEMKRLSDIKLELRIPYWVNIVPAPKALEP